MGAGRVSLPVTQTLARLPAPVLAFAASRLVLLLTSSVVAAVRDRSLLHVWDQWDSHWYLGIAMHGYSWGLHGKSALAFFPFFPLLVAVAGRLGLPVIIAGVLLSNAAFLASLFYLDRLVTEERDPHTAGRAVWLTALFPTSFFTFAPYSEALFLLAAIVAFQQARQGHALRAGLAGAAALLTRSTGVIVLPALLLLLGPRRPRSWLLGMGPSLLAGLGYLRYLQGEHLQIAGVIHAERAWHRAMTLPWTGFAASLNWLAAHGSAHLDWAVENILQLLVTIIFLGLTVLAARHLSRPAMLYCAGFWLVVLSSPEWLDNYYAPFSSMTRFVLVLFPVIVWMAVHLRGRRYTVTLALSTALLAGASAVHFAGGWVG